MKRFARDLLIQLSKAFGHVTVLSKHSFVAREVPQSSSFSRDQNDDIGDDGGNIESEKFAKYFEEPVLLCSDAHEPPLVIDERETVTLTVKELDFLISYFHCE